MPKILIIDDDHSTLDILRTLFQKKKYDVVTATNGKEGLEKVTNDVDVVLCDIMMPEINGYKFIQTVKKDMNRANLPVIFISSLTDQKAVVKGFEYEADDYITKPFRLEELLARVDRTLAKSQKTEAANILVSGDLQERDLIEILRFCEEHRISGQIVLTQEGQDGTIHLKLGEIEKIRLEDNTGEDALDQLLTWQTGSYKVVQEELNTCEPTTEESKKSDEEKIKILILDSDAESLDKLWNLLKDENNVIKGESLEEAFTILELQGKDWSDVLLINLDVFGEEILGLLIHAKKENPNLQIITFTSTKPPNSREKFLLNNPIIFLEKPVAEEQLNSALKQAVDLQCAISKNEEQYLELIDIIHLLTLFKSTVCLEIEKTSTEKARLFIEAGKVTQVFYQEQENLDAFQRILKWESGSFSIKFGEVAKEKKLDSPWWELLTDNQGATQIDISPEKLKNIQEKLSKLKQEISEIQNFGIITRNGKLLYSIFDNEKVCKEIHPIIIEMISASEELCQVADKSPWTEVSIMGENGDIHIWPITHRFILFLTTTPDTNWAMLNMYCEEISEEIATLLKN